jgi:penicillin-binding protein 1A
VPVRASRKPRSKRGRFTRVLKQGVVLLSIALCAGVAAALFVWIPIYRQAVTDASEIDSKLVVRSADPSTVVSSNGTVLYRIAAVRREVVPISSLPKYVGEAVVAAEDRRFYSHTGVDLIGLLRISFLALKDRHASQGGSTIEMQLAKNLVNGDARSLQRKLKDIATAQQIERLMNKEQILNLYMNQVYFGEGAFGIEAAAETYFGKHASKLDISEAAMLARCVRHPSRENPFLDMKGSIERRNYVLDVMNEEGWITDEQLEQAKNETPKLDRYTPQGVRWIDNDAGYFVQHVLRVFHDDYPNIDLKAGGYRIETTLNLKLQKRAVGAVAETLREHRGQRVNDAAILVMDAQGKILAEVGGPGYARMKWNVITQSKLQAGSSFKPFVYATALAEKAISMGDMVSNEPIYETRFGVPWNPKNNGREHVGGYVSLDSAFSQSINLPAIHTLQKVGAERVVSYAHDTFGFDKSHLPAYESLAIGTGEVYPLEMARAYSVFMLQGSHVDPYPIDRIIAPDGQPLKIYQPNKVSTGLSPQVCQDVDSLMRGVVEHGTGTAADDVPDARGKTGTTQDAKDAWFCGYSDGVLAVSWVGNMVRSHGRWSQLPMSKSVFGGTVTAGMWADVMQKAHQLNLCHVPQVAPERVASVHSVKPRQDRVTVDTEDNTDDSKLSPDNSDAENDDSAPATMDPTPPPVKKKARPHVDPPKPDDSSDAPSSDQTDDVKPARRADRKTTDDDSDYVTVEVCADTGMRASRYCPETVSRRFKRGTEPRQICRLHTGN